LIDTERLLGGDFLPAQRNPLPEIEQPAGAAAPQQKAEALKALEAEHIRNCARCSLCENRSQTVFGEGDPDADLVFIGEGPGEEEDRQGKPFVGRAGQLLNRMIKAMGLRREDVYICNLIKCRAPGNRAPAPEEIAACWSYLIRQLQIISPKVIVTLGNPATQNLLNTKVGITRMRGGWQRLPLVGEGLEGILVMPTFHPAYLLRQYSDSNRGKVWDDLQKVMAELGLKPPKRQKRS
jgi:DNA polymerase